MRKNTKKQKNIQKPRKKKALGQHFLRKQSVVDHMIEKVEITPKTSVLEIGCGDGFLTHSILEQTECKQLIVYEIDREWAEFVKNKIDAIRLDVRIENVLDANFDAFEAEKPWVVLANLPYQITFPIMFLFQKHKDLFEEGVVMVQEEVAQKIVAKRGKKYSATSIFLQYHFDFELMEKVEPEAFVPPPKVVSRLLYFKPKHGPSIHDAPHRTRDERHLGRTDDGIQIPEEEKFWKFLKLCFKFPRQTLKNNLKSTHYDYSKISSEILKLRSQQMSFQDFLDLWEEVRK